MFVHVQRQQEIQNNASMWHMLDVVQKEDMVNRLDKLRDVVCACVSWVTFQNVLYSNVSFRSMFMLLYYGLVMLADSQSNYCLDCC